MFLHEDTSAWFWQLLHTSNQFTFSTKILDKHLWCDDCFIRNRELNFGKQDHAQKFKPKYTQPVDSRISTNKQVFTKNFIFYNLTKFLKKIPRYHILLTFKHLYKFCMWQWMCYQNSKLKITSVPMLANNNNNTHNSPSGRWWLFFHYLNQLSVLSIPNHEPAGWTTHKKGNICMNDNFH